MLDLNFVRENIDKVRAALQSRRGDTKALDDFAAADVERRRVIAESDQLNARRNAASREIGALIKDGKKEEAEARRVEVSGLKDRIGELDQLRTQTESRMHDLLSALPNIPHESVPIGEEESDNVEVRRWGNAPAFDFERKDHVDLGTALGILDLERATRIAAARFAILNGAGAGLKAELVNLCLKIHTRELANHGPFPPFIFNGPALFVIAHFPKFEADVFNL